mgnify:CR=1 FL=1
MSNNPFDLFKLWYDEHLLKSKEKEPSAMYLATCNKLGEPSIRTILLKSYSNGGFVFFTNLVSQKGVEILENLQSLDLFSWS